MSKRRQSAQDQKKRIEAGCCPIHGVGMTHVEGLARLFSIVKCSRHDCGITAIEGRRHEAASGPFELLTLVTDQQLERLKEYVGEMEVEFLMQAWQAISAELQNVAASSEVQLPVAG